MTQETALITGASAGIGREFARVFAQNGYNLILVARSRDKLAALAEELSSQYAIRADVMAHDLAEAGAPQNLFEAVQAAGLQVDILINNAGLIAVKPFAEASLHTHLDLLQLNIVALTALTHCFVQPMLARGRGKILNIASIASFLATPTFSAYGASKAFVLSFSEGLAQELAGSGVTVTAFCPGFTRTHMLEQYDNLEAYIPEFMKLDAPTVAREGFKACMKGNAVYVDSWTNEVFVQSVRLQPRWLVRNVGGFVTRWVSRLHS